jgi:hypothetical protein
MEPFGFFDVWENTFADEWVIKTAGVLLALGVMWRYVFRPTIKFRRRVLQGVKRVLEVIELVEHELKPNSGATLRDAVDRIEARLAVVEQSRNPQNRTRSTDPEAHHENS